MSRARTWRSSTAGRTVNIDRLPALAADLVRPKVTVIAATGAPCGAGGQGGDHDDSDRLHDRVATRSELGLVASLRRPGGNVTGVTS